MSKFIVFFVGLCLGVVCSASEVIRVACVGDSITYGVSIKDRTTIYPNRLGRMLGTGYKVFNFGISGATMLNKGNSPYMKSKRYKNLLKLNPDIVVIKLGTNDSKPINWVHGGEYVSDYLSMIQSFKSLESKPKIYVCKPVPAYKTRPGKIDARVVLEEIIPKVEEVAKQTGAVVIDLYTALSNKEELFPDKIHPNGDGYAIIARTVYTALTGKEYVENADSQSSVK